MILLLTEAPTILWDQQKGNNMIDFLKGIIVGAAVCAVALLYSDISEMKKDILKKPVNIVWPDNSIPEPELSFFPLPQSLPVIDEVNYNDENRKCLSLGVYFEARNQPVKGQLGVAYVTLNRVHDKRFPDTICGVVKQGKYKNGEPARDQCQFSFWCDGVIDIPKNMTAWDNARKIANHALDHYTKSYQDVTHGALYYHATYVKPDWSRFNLEHSVTIGNHIFYRTKDE